MFKIKLKDHCGINPPGVIHIPLTPTPMFGGVKMTISQTYVKLLLPYYMQSYPHSFKQYNFMMYNGLKEI